MSGTLAATTTAASIGTVSAYQSVLIQADPDNTANIQIGPAASQYFELRPGDAVVWPIPQAAAIHAKSVSGTQTLNWIGSHEPAPLTFHPATLANPQPFAVTGTIEDDATPAMAAAGNYADNDVVSNDATAGQGDAWVFDGMARVNGGRGVIRTISLTCSEPLVVASFRLHLFNANPSASELDDNAAFSVHANDQAKQIGHIDIPALVTGRAAVTDLYFPYTCAAADDALYGILQITDAETNEAAGMVVVIALGVDRYV